MTQEFTYLQIQHVVNCRAEPMVNNHTYSKSYLTQDQKRQLRTWKPHTFLLPQAAGCELTNTAVRMLHLGIHTCNSRQTSDDNSAQSVTRPRINLLSPTLQVKDLHISARAAKGYGKIRCCPASQISYNRRTSQVACSEYFGSFRFLTGSFRFTFFSSF